jgi:DNA/RNA-binding domain of Phe-tRNA-synthetase-like protein
MDLEFSVALTRQDVAIAVVAALGVSAGPASSALEAAIVQTVQDRRAQLPGGLEQRRQACREMLRNGSYKPTGRAKPASEYLLRAAAENTFPRINAIVDANNLVSLLHLLPISVWDIDLADSRRFEFRLGAESEQYVFNSGGQVLELRDLLGGYAFQADSESWKPIVNPVKDSLATKTTAETRNVAAAIYCPLSPELDATGALAIANELLGWLVLASGSGQAGVALAGSKCVLSL